MSGLGPGALNCIVELGVFTCTLVSGAQPASKANKVTDNTKIIIFFIALPPKPLKHNTLFFDVMI